MSKYAGTQTEKNLEAAFAGESQARNKYTYFASAAKKEGYQQIAALFEKTAANVPARTMSGLICTPALPRQLTKRDFPNWQRSSVWWQLSRSITRRDIVRSLRTSRLQQSLRRAKSRCGSAATAVTSSSVPRLRKSARRVRIRRAFSRSTQKTTNQKSFKATAGQRCPAVFCT